MTDDTLMSDLIGQLDKIAAAEDAARITELHVWLGALCQMSRAQFADQFEVAAKNTIAEGAELKITVSDDPDDPSARTIILEGVEVETAES